MDKEKHIVLGFNLQSVFFFQYYTHGKLYMHSWNFLNWAKSNLKNFSFKTWNFYDLLLILSKIFLENYFLKLIIEMVWWESPHM